MTAEMSHYQNNYYCSPCGIWIKKEDAKKDKIDRPKCPNCGRRLRTRPSYSSDRVAPMPAAAIKRFDENISAVEGDPDSIMAMIREDESPSQFVEKLFSWRARLDGR